MDKIIGLENDSAERFQNRENIPPRKDEATFDYWVYRKDSLNINMISWKIMNKIQIIGKQWHKIARLTPWQKISSCVAIWAFLLATVSKCLLRD